MELSQLVQKRVTQLNQNRISSIEQTQVSKPTERSIEQPSSNKIPVQGEIPGEIDELIGNKMYRNRYKRLIREGYLKHLLYLADYAKRCTKENKPREFFGKMCSLARWEGTLRWANDQFKVMDKAAEVARQGIKITSFVYKQIRKGVNVVRLAVQSNELGKDKDKYFAWLCTHEKDLANYA